MNRIKNYLPVTLMVLALSCGTKSTDKKESTIVYDVNNSPSSITEDEEQNLAMTDSTVGYFADRNSRMNPLTSSAARGFVGDTSKIFIKTADIKFRVKSTIRATYEIEDATNRFGGYVEYTNLQSRVDSKNTVAVSEDSLLETVHYTVENTMVLRVPANKMDSCLRAISPLVDYMDYRTIKTRNVYLDLLTKKLAQERIKKFQSKVQLAADKHGDHLDEITESQESMLDRQEQADQAKIDALALKDSVEYSTISLSIYQRDAIKRELVYNEKNIEAYEPGFGYKLKQSFKRGWKATKNIVLFFANFWVLFVLAAVLILVVRLVIKK